MAGREEKNWRNIGFLIPLLAFVVVFVFIPLLGTLRDSFYLDVPYRETRFVGFANYEWLFLDPGFHEAIVFTFLFVIASVPLQVLVGLAVALVLNERIPFRGAVRACVLVPWAIPAAISARIFELIYNYSYGAANYLLKTFRLHNEPVNWLGSEIGAFVALVVADSWKTAPFAAIILLAGLSAISGDLYNQAMIDQASMLQRFCRITVPLLKPVLIVTVLFRAVDSLRIFDVIYVLTGGGPGGATASVSLFSFEYFSAADFGYGSASSAILFLSALILSMALVRAGNFGREVL